MRLPDGRIATIGEYQAAYDEQARVSLIAGRTASFVGPAGPGRPLPVLARLPDDQGWAAAAKGATLGYQTTVDGPWQGTRADALPAPPGTVRIQVVRPGRQPVAVDVR